jgi:hypothetical protein
MEYAVHRVKVWQYESLHRALRKVATPLGRRSGKGAGRGRPMWWWLDSDRMRLRSPRGKWERRQARREARLSSVTYTEALLEIS